MKENMKIKMFVKIDGKYEEWDTLGEEKKKEIGAVLNDRALRAMGYIPAGET
jgi:hypothetical protein